MVAGGAQVLPQRQDRDAVLQQIVHGAEKLFFRFPQAQHDAALGRHFAVHALQSHPENAQGPPVLGAEADNGREAFHRLQIVSENMRTGRHQRLDGGGLLIQVRGKHFNDRGRAGFSDGPNYLGEMRGGAVRQIIPGDHGNYGVAQLHVHDGFRHVLRFFRIQRAGLGRAGGAESAGARAPFSGNHERGRTLVPTFITVGAVCFFTDGEEVFAFHKLLDVPEFPAVGQTNLDPRRFAFRSFRSLIVVPAFHSPASLP